MADDDARPVRPNGLEVRARRHAHGWSPGDLIEAIARAHERATGLRNTITPHVLRSSAPDAGFLQLNAPGPPYLQDGLYTDASAAVPTPDEPLWHYLAFVSNGCEEDNRDLDVFRTPLP